MNRNNSHSPHNHYTTRTAKAATYAHSIAAVIVMLLSPGCGPGIGTDAGDSFGDTASTETGAVDPGEPLVPDGEVRCVERDPGVVTCWIGWGAAKARVLLPCEAELAVTAGVWSAAYDDTLEWWGPVSCHDVTGSDFRLCMYSSARVLLTETADGWEPEVSATVCGLDEVDAPCGDECVEYPGSLGCECVAGEPGAPLECVDEYRCIDGLCSSCPVGQLGCTCGDMCDVGLGCTLGDVCVDCDFITGVSGCACNISNECESTSVCVDGMCGPY